MDARHGVWAVFFLIYAGLVTPQDPATETQSDASAPAADVATIPVDSAGAPPAPAGAPPAPAAVAEESPTALDEIQVTAQRKVSNVQDTPISIEAFNSEKLALRGIDGLAGLAANVPSMTIEPFPTHNATLRMFIRGVGTADAQVTQDPAVGVYVDGVYIARSVGLAIDTADLERIEVLRGPQGTLYGRNTTGGAINLVTRRPDPALFTMAHQVSYGARGYTQGKSSFNVPLGADLAAKVSVLGSLQDGFVENTGPGGDFSDRRQFAARFDLRWRASDWLTADYSYDRTDLRYFNGQFQSVLGPETNHGLAEYFKRYAQQETVYSDRRLEALATGMPLEPSRSRINGHALTLAAPLGDYDLKYIGAYRRLTDDEYVDLGGGGGSQTFRLDTHYYDGPSTMMVNGGPTPLVVPQVYQSQSSHELQLSGRWFDGTLEFIAGVFQFEENGGENGHPLHHILNTYVDPQDTAALFASDPAAEQLFLQMASPNLVVYWDYDYQIHNTAKAAFTQLTWSPEYFDRRLHLTLGVRKSWDSRAAVKNFVQDVYAEGRTAQGEATAVEVPRQATPGNDVFVDEHAQNSYSDFSPSFNLQYELSTDATVYFSSARAYKSGGFNVRDPQISGASGPASDDENYGFGYREGFRPEFVQSYEAGLKSEWFRRRLRFNAALFESRFTDMQTNFLIAGTIADTKARNVGKARIRGLEFETSVVAASGLVFALDYSWLDARVLEVLDLDGNNVAHLYPFVSAPPKSYVGSIDWTFLERSWGSLRAYASYHYLGKRTGVVITEARRGLTSLPGYGSLNARLLAGGLRLGEHGTLEVALWGRNLADEEYTIFAIDNLPQADRAVLWGEPRSAGMDLVYRFQ